MTTPPPAGDLLTAAGKLREHREALPDVIRKPWLSSSGAVWTDTGGPGDVLVADGVGWHEQANAAAAHIALVASPHVTEALEKLLETADSIDLRDALHARELDAAEVLELIACFSALAAAINHTGSRT